MDIPEGQEGVVFTVMDCLAACLMSLQIYMYA